MEKLRILPPEKLQANARAAVRKFQLEKRRREFEAKKQADKGEETTKAVQQLIDKMDDGFALRHAASCGDEEKVIWLLKTGVDVDSRSPDHGITPLIEAAMNGNSSMVILLCTHGADVDAKDARGWTAMMYAAKDGEEGVARVLFANNANINLMNDEGFTALDIALGYKARGIFNFLKLMQGKLGKDIEGHGKELKIQS